MKSLLLSIAFATLMASAPQAAEPPPPDLSISAGAWRQDLEFVRAELPKRHLRAFHATTRAAFNTAIRTLEAQASEQSPDERLVGLLRAVNTIGDGHTGLILPSDRAYMPIVIGQFGSEFRVTRAAPGAERLLGARVMAIGGVPVASVLKSVLELTPQDENSTLRHSLALGDMSYGLILHGLGITHDRDRARYTFRDDHGEDFTTDLSGSPARDLAKWSPAYSKPMLADGRPGETFWCAPVDSGRAIYCDFRAYDDLHKKARQLFALLPQTHTDKVIIDLRQNGGGDYTVGEAELVRPIACRTSINRPGHLFVLIGPRTFSAAMNNAAQFRSMTQATLVGEPIGEKPNSYQEPREVPLPNSHLVLRYSTRWYAFVKGGPNEVAPDVLKTPTWDQYVHGVDPALQYAIDAKAGARSGRARGLGHPTKAVACRRIR